MEADEVGKFAATVPADVKAGLEKMFGPPPRTELEVEGGGTGPTPTIAVLLGREVADVAANKPSKCNQVVPRTGGPLAGRGFFLPAIKGWKWVVIKEDEKTYLLTLYKLEEGDQP